MSKKANDPHRLNARSTVDLKVVIVGEANVGKTCLMVRYMERKFSGAGSTCLTIGASFSLKHWNGHSIAIWDTAGEERYSGLGSYYFRSAAAAVLAFDMTHEETIDVLRNRFLPMLEHADKDCFIAVVGTKLDLVRYETRQRCSTLANNLIHSLKEQFKEFSGMSYFETSSLSGQNVDRVFEYVFENYFTKNLKAKRGRLNRDKERIQSINLTNSVKTSNRVRCCNT